TGADRSDCHRAWHHRARRPRGTPRHSRNVYRRQQFEPDTAALVSGAQRTDSAAAVAALDFDLVVSLLHAGVGAVAWRRTLALAEARMGKFQQRWNLQEIAAKAQAGATTCAEHNLIVGRKRAALVRCVRLGSKL